MLRKEFNKFPFLVFEKMGVFPELAHGFSLRKRAEAGEEVDFSGKRPELARRSRQDFCRALGLEPDKLARTGQVHGSEIAVVGEAGSYPEIDGLITNEPGKGLLLLGADCLLVLVYDPAGRVVGAAHAGWRGTVRKITKKLVARMAGEFHGDPGGFRAGIAPGVCGRCYEVGAEVVEAASGLENSGAFVKPSPHGTYESPRWHFDLAEANRRQLGEAGLREGHIELSHCCTFEEQQFHSHRRDGERSGRAALLAGMV